MNNSSILRFTGLVAYVTKTFQELPENTHASQPPQPVSSSSSSNGEKAGTGQDKDSWLKDFKDVVASLQVASHHVTSLLAILSGALQSGKPLPPYLQPPERMHLGQMLRQQSVQGGDDTDILSAKHVCEPGYSAFAVMQVSTTMVIQDLADLLADAKKLLGEADFEHLDVVQQDYERQAGDASTSNSNPTLLRPSPPGPKED
jgi:hypothetical protein